MTFNELSTILCQIEALINSRPLVALYDNVESLDVRTTAHFLIGKPPTPFPNLIVMELKSCRKRWHALDGPLRMEALSNELTKYIVKTQVASRLSEPGIRYSCHNH